MKVLITGGAGFIGSHIADACIEAGYNVMVIDDLSSGKRQNVPQAAQFVQADICDGRTINAVISSFRPDAVMHQAAQVSVTASTHEPARDAQINIIGSINLLQAAIGYGIKHLVFASTGGAIYGEVEDGKRADVDWPANPLTPYACSKYAVENYLKAYSQQYGLPCTILRYANVYGPRQDPHGEAGVVAIFAQRLLSGEALQINARREQNDAGCVRDYIYVRDVVDANMRAIRGELSETIINVGTGKETSTLELAQNMAGIVGVEATLHYEPARKGDLERSVLQPQRGLLAAPTALSHGLSETLAWFSAQG